MVISPLTFLEFLLLRDAYIAKPSDLDVSMFCNKMAAQLNKQRREANPLAPAVPGAHVMDVLRNTFVLKDCFGTPAALAPPAKSLLEEAGLKYCASPVITTCLDCRAQLKTTLESNCDVFFYSSDLQRGTKGYLFARECTSCSIRYEVDGYIRRQHPGFKHAYTSELENPRWERFTRQTVIDTTLFKGYEGTLHFHHGSFEGFTKNYNFMRGPGKGDPVVSPDHQITPFWNA